MQVHKKLNVPPYRGHIGDLPAIFESKLADVGNPVVRQLGRYLRLNRLVGASRPVVAIATVDVLNKRIAFSCDLSKAFGLPWLSFQ